MTPAQPITKGQRTKLQTLWTQYARRSLDVLNSSENRSVRLCWVSDLVQRQIRSFNDLTAMEAARAISALNRAMGMPGHKPRSRDRARSAGTHGRRGDKGRSVELASTEDLARIERAIERLGWTRERFDAWLSSPSSPLGTHGKPQIRTVAHANKVWWAMKRLLKSEGKWEE